MNVRERMADISIYGKLEDAKEKNEMEFIRTSTHRRSATSTYHDRFPLSPLPALIKFVFSSSIASYGKRNSELLINSEKGRGCGDRT